MGMTVGLMVGGLVLLTVGGELLVRGASRLAAVAGITPLVIGLTVVSFGTSAPELAVSMGASFAGQTDIAVGNVVGSNIMNVLFILGLAAMIAPLIVSSQLIRLDVPLMVAACVTAFLMGLDGAIGRVDGILLFGALLCYIGWSVVQSRKETADIQQEYADEYGGEVPSTWPQILLQLVLIVVGLAVLTLGARWLVNGATEIARWWGMDELLIGLTIVAAGTSLPEAAASVMASIRGERDIAVGNVVGSNIFNIMCVLGLSAAVAPGGVEVSSAALQLDMPVMIVVAVACLPIFYTKHLIARWEGALFFAYYIIYTVYLVLSEKTPAAARTIGFVTVVFLVPLTVVTLIVAAVRYRASRLEERRAASELEGEPPAE